MPGGAEVSGLLSGDGREVSAHLLVKKQREEQVHGQEERDRPWTRGRASLGSGSW